MKQHSPFPTPHSLFPILIFSLFFFLFSFFSCTFNYGDEESEGSDQPDLIMENVEYVRVRSSDPIARFTAERAERYEEQGVMKITNFSFEQYGEKGAEVNAFGTAGFASVDIETGDIFMDNGVIIEVQAEDIIISTTQLEWLDDDKILLTGEQDEVNILQHKGTNFIGIGLKANARSHTFEFLGSVSGIYIHEDDEDGDGKKDEQWDFSFDEYETAEDSYYQYIPRATEEEMEWLK